MWKLHLRKTVWLCICYCNCCCLSCIYTNDIFLKTFFFKTAQRFCFFSLNLHHQWIWIYYSSAVSQSVTTLLSLEHSSTWHNIKSSFILLYTHLLLCLIAHCMWYWEIPTALCGYMSIIMWLSVIKVTFALFICLTLRFRSVSLTLLMVPFYRGSR